MTEIENKSLLRCTWNKSVDVFKKVLLCVSGFVVGVAALWIAHFIASTVVWKPLVNLISDTISVIWLILTSLGNILLAIPWYVYVGAIALLAIPVYSLIWCIARELTDEDWKSDDAEITSDVTALFVFFAMFTTTTSISMIIFGINIDSVGVGVVTGLSGIGFSLFVLSGDPKIPKILLFPGAYLHYRRRMKLSGGVE